MSLGSAAVLAAALSVSVAIGGQQSGPHLSPSVPAPGKNTLHLHANLIYVPVIVTDVQGHPIADLHRNNFLLTEDGQPQTIRMFDQRASQPLSVVLAVDTSVSVRRNLAQEKRAVHAFAHALLHGQSRLALTGFSGRVREFAPFTGDAARIDRALGGLRADGPTALYGAIVQAAQMLKSQPGRRTLILLSDGANSMPGVDYSRARLAALQAEASIDSVILLPIAANAGRNLGGEHAMIQLSRDTGGQFFYARDAGELQASLARIAECLPGEYLLGYYAPSGRAGNDKGAEDYRHIQVKILHPAADQPMHLYFRKGYFPEPEH
ncbi:MAG TPA: VWA domain-containing protein [Acidobacteriaceae bacterium]|nr:VWA domain-containing protein [Acidobacteriaceae bacterium]